MFYSYNLTWCHDNALNDNLWNSYGLYLNKHGYEFRLSNCACHATFPTVWMLSIYLRPMWNSVVSDILNRCWNNWFSSNSVCWRYIYLSSTSTSSRIFNFQMQWFCNLGCESSYYWVHGIAHNANDKSTRQRYWHSEEWASDTSAFLL